MASRNAETETHMRRRETALAALSAEPLDVLVVGGGIVGAGIARDAAMRGLRSGLVEQYDFAWGTSSRSSRLLHGGIRYLARGQFGLVREASLEKGVVRQIAPHLTAPLPFIFPTYRGTSWPRWKLRIGVRLYDLMCSGRNFGSSSVLNVSQLREYLPGVNTAKSTGAVRYFDGATNDSRLVLDTLRSATRHGAIVCSYTRLEDAVPADPRWRCRLRDMLNNHDHEVVAQCVVNATGPWAGQFKRSRIRIRGTKGVHMVLDQSRLPVGDAVMMTAQRRVAYAIPWGQRVYVGTTDTDYEGRLEDVRTEPDDIQYLLELLNHYFPESHLTEDDIWRTWAGVRPLVVDRHGAPSEVSRSHGIHLAEDGWMDVAGGKLTTYRRMAQDVVDRVVRWLGRQARPCRTDQVPLLEPGEADNVSGIIPPAVNPSVVHHYCRNEWAVHLDDVMVRRTRWHYYYRDTHQIAQRVAGWMGSALGWSADRQTEEIKRYQEVLD